MSGSSCPRCGETPMFRSQVHACCEEVEALRTRVKAVREVLFDTALPPAHRIYDAIEALNRDTSQPTPSYGSVTETEQSAPTPESAS